MLKPKPWWLRILTSKACWVTIRPNIYFPADVDPTDFPAVQAHEEAHLGQQGTMGVCQWLWRYFTSRAFRLDQEVRAIAVEVRATPLTEQDQIVQWYSKALLGRGYFHCAFSIDVARKAIEEAMDEAGDL